MTPARVLDRLTGLGVVVMIDGAALDLEGPNEAMTPELLAHVAANKSDLMTLVAAYEPEPAVVDIETRAVARLDEVGGRAYAADALMEVICVVTRLPGGVWIEWTPGQPCPRAVADAVEKGVLFLAHNAYGFDKFVWQRLGWPEPVWCDTMQVARLAGLPASLDALAAAVLGDRKDNAGRKVTLALGRVDRRTGKLSRVNPRDRQVVVEYCKHDVDLTFRVWRAALAPFRSVEPDIREVDCVVNERGFMFDAELARGVMRLEQALVLDAERAAPVSGTVLSSPAKLKRWLRHAGITVDNVRAATLEGLLDDPDLPDDVVRVLTARLISSGITSRKLRRALKWQSPDGRLRDTLVYHAAHTGRWSGRGFQPQNLPRIPEQLDVAAVIAAARRHDIEALAALAADTGVRPEEALGALLRPCIVASSGKVLAAVDYSQIEARALMWVAEDGPGLDAFRCGRDVYREEAAALFCVSVDAVTKAQRLFGKVAVLGCGYGMGAERFKEHAMSYGVDWTATQLAPASVVDAWRDHHPRVAGWRTGDTCKGHIVRRGGLWRDVEGAARKAIERGICSVVGHCEWARECDALVVTLPSGRRLFYRAARVEPVPKPWGTGPGITYAHRKSRSTTWGGKLIENVVQAACRDLLAEALLRLERANLAVVLHVHDEIICEVERADDLSRVQALMEAVPPWADGLPIATDGYVALRYGVEEDSQP